MFLYNIRLRNFSSMVEHKPTSNSFRKILSNSRKIFYIKEFYSKSWGFGRTLLFLVRFYRNIKI